MKKISNSVLHERPADDLGQVYNGDHHFFSEYAANLSNLLAASDWTNVLRLAKTLIDARKKQSKIFLCEIDSSNRHNRIRQCMDKFDSLMG